ncbi:hypothetical protein [Myroides guanonis]|uniref:Uncharacterized protein n=1 Tax=Myroides guanonis TaxID=1150112 RepID=A0A1I3QLU0_9FLAO|nr:hypothetical protein [Myroides guanonis]SFJ34499.1 hypothetical protein SAMN04487893_10633 [Myroides guanonis]
MIASIGLIFTIYKLYSKDKDAQKQIDSLNSTSLRLKELVENQQQELNELKEIACSLNLMAINDGKRLETSRIPIITIKTASPLLGLGCNHRIEIINTNKLCDLIEFEVLGLSNPIKDNIICNEGTHYLALNFNENVTDLLQLIIKYNTYTGTCYYQFVTLMKNTSHTLLSVSPSFIYTEEIYKTTEAFKNKLTAFK